MTDNIAVSLALFFVAVAVSFCMALLYIVTALASPLSWALLRLAVISKRLERAAAANHG